MKVGVGGGRERLKKKGDLPRLSISEFKNVFTDLTVPLPRHFPPNCLLSFFSLRASRLSTDIKEQEREGIHKWGEKNRSKSREGDTFKKHFCVDDSGPARFFTFFGGR